MLGFKSSRISGYIYFWRLSGKISVRWLQLTQPRSPAPSGGRAATGESPLAAQLAAPLEPLPQTLPGGTPWCLWKGPHCIRMPSAASLLIPGVILFSKLTHFCSVTLSFLPFCQLRVQYANCPTLPWLQTLNILTHSGEFYRVLSEQLSRWSPPFPPRPVHWGSDFLKEFQQIS